jgi:hypothetical protein
LSRNAEVRLAQDRPRGGNSGRAFNGLGVRGDARASANRSGRSVPVGVKNHIREVTGELVAAGVGEDAPSQRSEVSDQHRGRHRHVFIHSEMGAAASQALLNGPLSPKGYVSFGKHKGLGSGQVSCTPRAADLLAC